MAFFVLPAATRAADDGTLPSMVQSAQLRQPLMVLSTWKLKRIYIEYDKLKESVRKSKRALFAWDSGSVIVLV